MPEIQVRSAIASDIASIIALEHNYTTDYVWQMEIHQYEEDDIRVSFRQARLPRSTRVDYPRSPHQLQENWKHCSDLLVASLQDEVVGYVSLNKSLLPATAWMVDLVVTRRVRRQGIGTTLVLAAQDWCAVQSCSRVVLEMQPKNYPAICLARKLGFGFCGYNDYYYANQDIALFFAKTIH